MPRVVNVMVLRRPSLLSRSVRIKPRELKRETTSAIVDRSSEIRSPSVRWSRLDSAYRALSAANCGEVIVCETSAAQSTFITWTARRSRWPGCRMRSSGAWSSGGSFLTFRLHHPITHRQQAQPHALLDRPPQSARQHEREQRGGGAPAGEVPRAAPGDGRLDRTDEDRAQDGTLESAQAADQDHEDHVSRPLDAEDRTRLDEQRVGRDQDAGGAAAETRQDESQTVARR